MKVSERKIRKTSLKEETDDLRNTPPSVRRRCGNSRLTLGHSKENRLLNQDFKEILSTFIEEKVEFLGGGGYAMAFHGYVRATGDIDL